MERNICKAGLSGPSGLLGCMRMRSRAVLYKKALRDLSNLKYICMSRLQGCYLIPFVSWPSQPCDFINYMFRGVGFGDPLQRGLYILCFLMLDLLSAHSIRLLSRMCTGLVESHWIRRYRIRAALKSFSCLIVAVLNKKHKSQPLSAQAACFLFLVLDFPNRVPSSFLPFGVLFIAHDPAACLTISITRQRTCNYLWSQPGSSVTAQSS